MSAKGKTIRLEVSAKGEGKTGNDQHDDDEIQLGPLFALDGMKAARHTATRIYRQEPIEEGQVGKLGPDGDEATIFRRWGGGTYNAQAVDAKGKIIIQREVKLAGEPKFDNAISRRMYERWLKQQFSDPGALERGGRTNDEQIALEDSRHKRDLEKIKAEADAAVAKAKAEGEALAIRLKADREEAEEREERRRKRDKDEHEQALSREREHNKSILEQQNAFFRNTMEARDSEPAGAGKMDPVTKKLIDIALSKLTGDGDDEYPDAGTAVAARIPEIVEGINETITLLKGDGSDKKKGKRGKASEDSDEDDRITLDEDLSAKARRAARNIKRLGRDPSKVMGAVLTRTFENMAKIQKVEGGKGKPATPIKSGTRKAK